MALWARLRSISLWQAYLAVGALICALYVWVPPFAGSGPVFNLLGLSPLVAIIVGVRRYRPRVGRTVALVRRRLLAVLAGRPLHLQLSASDRHRGAVPVARRRVLRDRLPRADGRAADARAAAQPRSATAPVAIDSLIMTLGLALISWIALIQPSLHDEELSTVAKLVSIAYPIGDILLLAAAIRLAVDSGTRRPAFYLLVSSIVALLRPTSPTVSSPSRAPMTARSCSTSAGSASTCCGALRRCTRRWSSSGPRPRPQPAADAAEAGLDADLRLLIAPVMALLQVIDEGDDQFCRQCRRDHPVRPRRRPDGRTGAPAGALRRASGSSAPWAPISSPPPIARTSAVPCSARRGRSPETMWPPGSAWRRASASSSPTSELAAAWPVTPATAAALLDRSGAPGSQRHLSASALVELRVPATSASTLLLPLSVRGETHGLLTIAGEKPIRERCRAASPRSRPRSRSRSRARP